tara:strand:+ start:3236 stop:3361 length:126 start_codon:yes stop_codon:yes gene_type:complete
MRIGSLFKMNLIGLYGATREEATIQKSLVVGLNIFVINLSK